MKKYLKNVTGSDIHVDDLGQTFEPDDVFPILYADNFMVDCMNSSDLEAEIMAGNIEVGSSTTNFYSDPLEGLMYLKSKFGDDAYFSDGTSLIEVTDFVITDETTGKKSSFYFLKLMEIIRDLYNDGDNPLYNYGHTKLLGTGGTLEVIGAYMTRFDSTASIVFNYDGSRGKWLSPTKILVFSRNSAAQGAYLKVGEVSSHNYGYKLQRDFTIVSMSLQAKKGSSTRKAQIRKNGSSVLEFDVIDLNYDNTELSIDFDKGDDLQIFINQMPGQPLKHIICTLEISWRYTE